MLSAALWNPCHQTEMWCNMHACSQILMSALQCVTTLMLRTLCLRWGSEGCSMQHHYWYDDSAMALVAG